VEVDPLLLGGYEVVSGGTLCATCIGLGRDMGRFLPMVGGGGGAMNGGWGGGGG